MTKLVVIQKDDDKSLRWAEAAQGAGIELLPQPGTPIKAPLFLLQTIWHRGRPAGYVVRYLNDYPSLPKTLLRLVSEVTLVILCLALKVKLFWICHNVDKESSAYYPRISTLRRRMFASQAKRIFTTDPLLVPHARQYFASRARKIAAISFGRIPPDERVDRDKEQIAIEFIEDKLAEAKSEGVKPLVIFCTGSPAEKSRHFDHLEALMDAAQKVGYRAISIVAGEFLATARGRALAGRYSEHSDICFFPVFTRFSSQFVRKYVNAYWRGYDDWSVPFTIYEAATLRKPVLALEGGFLPELVGTYGIGATTPSSFISIDSVLENIEAVARCGSFDHFLAVHTWSSLSLALNEALDE